MEGSSNSAHFLAAFLILFAFHFNSISAAGPAARKDNTEFIRTSCGTTIYPRLCFTSLSAHANVIQTSPRLLADTALSVTLSTARSTSSVMSNLLLSHGLKPREVVAMKDCVEELSDSVDQLRKAMGEMNQIKGSNFGLIMNDIQTWVSAALTYEDTCTDGFAGNTMDGKLKKAVRTRIVKIAHMTSNALALINSYASFHN
ncbi:hypothetical protein VitviT2T_024750 [Vitis vinifera]|uniref:Pectinesterase inhibitor domain-containing protein n=2 Tax=Vitis vinifera TaxID=29760 RepID=A0ABY9DJT2_VITVI|nr:21 kDa protein [Vitis vinifera]WKA06870.1 hypothetical protein VitviT2T_024750 [Vitis vinifera]|eukprot:XP_002263991.1 PREDICTED: 21 kDa protein [Vitis vinifera]